MGKKTLAITAVHQTLICHEFESEAEALRILPYIKKWSRETWDKRYDARYHSKEAIKYWDSRKLSDKIKSTTIIHSNRQKQYVYG